MGKNAPLSIRSQSCFILLFVLQRKPALYYWSFIIFWLAESAVNMLLPSFMHCMWRIIILALMWEHYNEGPWRYNWCACWNIKNIVLNLLLKVEHSFHPSHYLVIRLLIWLSWISCQFLLYGLHLLIFLFVLLKPHFICKLYIYIYIYSANWCEDWVQWLGEGHSAVLVLFCSY
jgi:hypothetical protein